MDLTPVQKLVDAAIVDGVFPGAVFGVVRGSEVAVSAHGRYTYCPESPLIAPDTIWDLASVSKVVGTTTAAMRLYEAGKLDLDARVASVLPTFGQNGKDKITFRNLLVHDSGLIAFRPYHRTCTTPEEVIAKVDAEGLTYETGTKMVYSDLNMIALSRSIEILSRSDLDYFLFANVFLPLGMSDTGYLRSAGREPSPGALDPSWCAPTETAEPWRFEQRRLRAEFLSKTASERKRRAGVRFADQEIYVQGEVHDPTAMTLGGVAGHAGLFSTAPDLLRFLRALLDGKIVRRATVDLFTKRQGNLSSRALGWDTMSAPSSAGTKFGPRSFGHTGYTGTSVWVDPDRDLAAVLLTNRVHPTSENTKIIRFRPVFHDAVVNLLTPQAL
ncbi:MAG: serine hydrolase domain-containing protein [Fimbriimonas sp.]